MKFTNFVCFTVSFMIIIGISSSCKHNNNEIITIKDTANQCCNYDELSPLLKKELNKILDSNTLNINLYSRVCANILQNDESDSTLLFFRDFFVIKFFNKKSDLYFSFWWQSGFPDIINSQAGPVIVDTNNVFYFNINNHNLLIIDYPISKGHNLYLKNDQSNKNAILAKKAFDLSVSRHGPIMTDRPVSYLTFLVKKDSLIKTSPIVPSKYENEKIGLIINKDTSFDENIEL